MPGRPWRSPPLPPEENARLLAELRALRPTPPSGDFTTVTVSATDLRRNLSHILDLTAHHDILVTRRGKPSVLLLTQSRYEYLSFLDADDA